MNSSHRILILLAVILFSCVKRDWTNPFDPASPKEMWTPTNFSAVQEGTNVKLTWSQPIKNISGFKLTKKLDTGAATDLQTQTKDATQLIDASPTGGKMHTYSIVAYAGNNSSNVVTVQIMPILAAGITTTAVSSVTTNSFITGGVINTDGGATITARGVCWSTNQNPTVADSKTADGTGSGSFTSTVTGLNPGVTYNIRAYATNSKGTSYGNQVSSATAANLPVLTTNSPSTVTTATATSGGTINSDGGGAITVRGVCWSTSQNPTIANSKTADGSGTGTFTSSVIGLSSATTYYLRAYATNSAGTAYGQQEICVSSYGTISDLDGNNYQTIKIGSQIWMRENLKTTKYRDGTIIPLVTDNTAWSNLSSPGYCWYNNDATTNKNSYGALYNWFTVNTNKLCPTGWHVPTDAEWTILTPFLGGESIGGGKLKETGVSHWLNPNSGATNETGFSLLPGGFRENSGLFIQMGGTGVWWKSSQYNAQNANGFVIYNNSNGIISDTYLMQRGYSIRCISGDLTFSTLTTTSVSTITSTSAILGGNISSDGGTPVTARGVCWSTTTAPTIANSKTSDGTGTGSFTSSLASLNPSTTYYVRAYATNSIGTFYGNEVSFTTLQSPIVFNTSKTYGFLSDVEGNIYKTIVIGTQTWMAENLKTTKYKDGTAIPLVTDNATWTGLTTPGFCWYNNDATIYKSTYGALYNWYSVNTNKLCPTGWHVPTDAEWTVLTTFLGGETVAGGKFKETGLIHWASPNTGATNETGFTAIPGGCRSSNGASINVSAAGYWWTSTESSTLSAWNRSMYLHSGSVSRGGNAEWLGFSVRCISGELTLPTVTNPSDLAVCQGSNATFSVSGGTTYQWELSNNSGTSWSSITGSISPTLTLGTVTPSMNGYKVRCQINGTPSNAATLTVNPTPVLNSTLTPPPICSGTAFNYTPSSVTAGTTFTWTRAVVAGISNPPAAGIGNSNEILNNTTSSPVVVTYCYTLSANGCTNPTVYYVAVTVNPTPTLTSSLTPPAICSGTVFSYIPTSSTPGVTFNWTRAVVPGISNPAAGGTNNPNETLINTTVAPIAVTYVYSLTAGGCIGKFNVTMVVNPSPSLNSTLTPAPGCSGSGFNYFPSSATSGVTYSWSRTTVSGISNPSSSGAGSLNETLVNTTNNPITVTYQYTLSANGCQNNQNVAMVINPTPAPPTSLGDITENAKTPMQTLVATATVTPGSTITWYNTPTGGAPVANPTLNVTGIVVYYAEARNGNCIAYPRTPVRLTINQSLPVVSDIDGNVYNTVTIGTQVWMKENLKTTKYKNGSAIPLVTDGSAWQNLLTSGFCWYNNDAATNKNIYGALYNWYTINTTNLCPTGWHVPTESEWRILSSFLGGESVAYGKLKETGMSHWQSPNAGATNETGYSALPGGIRYYSYGTFLDIGTFGQWWSATEFNLNSSISRGMSYDGSTVGGANEKANGLSVRCLKD